MKKSRKLWERTAAFTCAIALLSGNVLQVSPFTVYSLESDPEDSVSEPVSESTEDENQDNQPATAEGETDEPSEELVVISGYVYDEENKPLQGVAVSIAETEYTATTGQDGSYSIEVAKATAYTLNYKKDDNYVEQSLPLENVESNVDNANIVLPNSKHRVNFDPNDVNRVVYYLWNSQSDQYDKLNASDFEVEYNSPLQFKVEPTENYHLNSVTYNGQPVSKIDGTENEFVISQIKENSTVTVNITDRPTVTAEVIIPENVDANDYWAQKKDIKYSSAPENTVYFLYVPEGTSTGEPTIDDIVAEGSIVASGEGTQSVTQNGVAYFCVKDQNGAFSASVVKYPVDKIDTTAPKGTTPFIAINNGKTTLTANVSDDSSGIDKVYISKDGYTEAAILEATNSNTFVLSEASVSNINTYSVFVVDKAGNRFSYPLENIFTMSVTYTAEPTRWGTNRSISVSVPVDCDIPYTLYYSKKGGVEKEISGGTFSVKNNGVYTITAKDENGNVLATLSTDSISKIDEQNPVIDGQLVKEPYKEWYSSSIDTEVTIKGRASDDSGSISEIAYVAIPINAEEEPAFADRVSEGVTLNDDGTYEISISTAEEFNGIYRVWAVDGQGKPSSPVDCSIKIDNTKPQNLSMTYVAPKKRSPLEKVINALSFNLFFDSKIEITIEATDERENLDSGIAGFEYQLVEIASDSSSFDSMPVEENWKTDHMSVDGNIATITLSGDEFSDGFSGKIYARVHDNAGNYTSAFSDTTSGSFVVLDNKGGNIDLHTTAADGSEYTSQWTNQNVTIDISGGETLSGLGYYEYRIDYADPSLTDSAWAKLMDSNEEPIDSLVISEDVNATYFFRSVSNLDVRGDEKSVQIKVQKTIPSNAEVKPRDPDGTNGWNRTIPGIEVTEPVVNEFFAPVKTFYKLWNANAGEVEPATGTEYTDQNRPRIERDGVYQLRVWTEDEAGNHCVTDYTKEIKVDTSAPEYIDLFLETASVDGTVDILAANQDSVTYPFIYQNPIVVKSHFNCDISGLSKLEYRKVRSFSDDSGEWATFNGDSGLQVGMNEKFILAVKATDMAGNETVVYSNGIILDSEAPVGENVAPEITITPDAPNANGYHKGDVKVNIAVFDPPYSGNNYDAANGIYSGLESVEYRIITDGVETKREYLYQSQSNPGDSDLKQDLTQSITISSQENNSNNVYVEVIARDRAGNERINRTPEGQIQIDITAPTIRISYDNNSPDAANVEFFKGSRTATIEVTERNFKGDDVALTLTNSNGAVPSISGWTTSGGTGNGDNTVHTATLSFSSDGDYTFDIAYTDLAENACTEKNFVTGTAAPQKFTIDGTVPKITVSYDNNTVVNGKYFASGRTATVVINEHNFDAARIQITATASLDGKSITVPSKDVKWNDSGDNHSATIPYTADGDYTFDIKFTDMAGNVCDTPDFGTSTAGKDFVVDTDIDKPMITINDASGNGKAFKDDVVLAISFADINYDSYDVTLTRTRRNDIDVDVESEFISEIKVSDNAGEGVFDTFDKVQDNDGIYNLSVTLHDKAGNESTESIKYTVNRYGSVYEYSPYLADLISDGGAFVQVLNDDLVITEYNADKLVTDSLSIVLTRDGKPVDDVSCEVSPVINSSVSVGDSGWYQYDYVIAKDNFDADGVYKMVVSSEDEAGNTPENTNYEDQSILFRVDSTPPELTSITGLEDNIINAQNLTVGYDVYDTIGLKSVTVYLNGDEVDRISNFSSDMNNYQGTFDVGESKSVQNVKLVVEDMAGNITDTSSESFSSAYSFNPNFTVSTNMIVRWYANRPLFFGSIAGGVGLIGIASGLLVFLRKKKKNEA